MCSQQRSVQPSSHVFLSMCFRAEMFNMCKTLGNLCHSGSKKKTSPPGPSSPPFSSFGSKTDNVAFPVELYTQKKAKKERKEPRKEQKIEKIGRSPLIISAPLTGAAPARLRGSEQQVRGKGRTTAMPLWHLACSGQSVRRTACCHSRDTSMEYSGRGRCLLGSAIACL